MYDIKIIKPTIAKLTTEPRDSKSIVATEKISLKVNSVLKIIKVLNQKNKHIQVVIKTNLTNSIKENTIAWLFMDHIDISDLPNDLFDILSLENLIAIIQNVQRAKLYHKGLNVTFQEFKINTPQRLSSFLAQVCHESAGFIYAEEIASGHAYEGRKDLGNIVSGDGRRFKGRGLIQLTGRHNYKTCGEALKLDLINFPQKAAEPANAPRIAGWFWNSRNLNKLADQHNISAFKQITRRINGGLNGYNDRLNWWHITRKVLKC